MRLERLLDGVHVLERRGDPESVDIVSVAYDSRAVAPGALFCCVPGNTADGHDPAPAAAEAGAVALLCERFVPVDVVQARVASTRQAMAPVAAALHGHPSRALAVVGVTGTNGKTTVTHLVAAILEATGLPATVIGTLGGARTTPEAPVLHALLAEARDSGRRSVAMEVSSHALTEQRVEGIRFDVAVFTNLSHEHLDHHGTMEAYFAAKATLFTPEHASQGVANADDPWGRRLLESAPVPMTGFSTTEATDVVAGREETSFTWRGRQVRLRLRGAYHVANALAAAAAARALGIDDDAVVAGLAAAAPVVGRFEVVDVPAPVTAVVDYAHTPEGLHTALHSARTLAGDGRVLCVFGCGGDRDRAKRPAMGAVAATDADVVVVTSDNPRSEDPLAIIEEILAGVPDRSAVVVEPDRRAAIARAVHEAIPGDVVLLAGKGHEQTIDMGGTLVPFDDRREAADALRARFGEPEAS